eukprot:3962264-Pyramimonas_sp.AAC.1
MMCASVSSGDRKHGARGRGLATDPVSMGTRRFPPPNEAAPAAFWGGHLPGSMNFATARQIHGLLIHVCASPISVRTFAGLPYVP